MADNNVYENDDLGVSFRLPEKMTVRQQLTVRERVWGTLDDAPAAVRFWESMLPMVMDWESEDYPDPASIDIDTEDDLKATNIILWASARMADYFMDRGLVPKER